jgi:hypothetical protein
MTSELKKLDKIYDRWELRRYTQTWEDGKVREPVYCVALPVGYEVGPDGLRTKLKDFGYASSISVAVLRALEEHAKEYTPKGERK